MPADRAALVRVCDMLEHMTRYRHDQAHNGDIFRGGDYETCPLCAPVRTAIASAIAAIAAPPEALDAKLAALADTTPRET